MAYTQEHLDEAEAALQALARGERVVRVSHGDKMIEYGGSDLTKLREYVSFLKEELKKGSKRGIRFHHAVTTKGF